MFLKTVAPAIEFQFQLEILRFLKKTMGTQDLASRDATETLAA